jgi:hypothetical protein
MPSVLKSDQQAHNAVSIPKRASFLETGTLYQSSKGLNIEEMAINTKFTKYSEIIQIL